VGEDFKEQSLHTPEEHGSGTRDAAQRVAQPLWLGLPSVVTPDRPQVLK